MGIKPFFYTLKNHNLFFIRFTLKSPYRADMQLWWSMALKGYIYIGLLTYFFYYDILIQIKDKGYQMKKEYVEGWGVPFTKVRSDFAQAKYEMEGRCRKEKWSDEKWEVENKKINDMNLSKTPNDRVFED